SEVVDITGTSTTSTSFVDIPDFSLTFFLDKEAECLLYMSLLGSVASPGDNAIGYYRMVIDDTPILETQRLIGFSAAKAGSALLYWGAVTALTKRVLSPGQHTLKGQFAAATDSITLALTRTIGVIALTR